MATTSIDPEGIASDPEPSIPPSVSASQVQWLAALMIVALGVVAYSQTVGNEFVWDDASSILLHEHVKDPASIGRLFLEDQHAFGRGQGNFYRPLLSVTFMVDYLISGGEPETPISEIRPLVFHVSNMAWHIAAAMLFLLLLSRVRCPPFVSGIAAALYVVHPLHTEAVAYISGRADSLAAAFMFAGLYASLTDKAPADRIKAYTIGLLAFVAALLSKESAAIYPVLLALMIALYGLARGNGAVTELRERWIPLAGSAAILAIYALLRSTVLDFETEATRAAASPFMTRVVESLQAFALYIGLIFAPVRLHMERTLDGVPMNLAFVGLALAVVLLGILAAAIRFRQYGLAFSVGWFFVTWLPISGLFPLNAPMAEHWMYVPLAGFLWALAEMLHGAIARIPKLAFVCYPLVYGACLALVAITVDRTVDWRDNRTIFEAILRDNPRSIRAHYNLAVTYEDLRANPMAARRHFQEVVRIFEDRKALEPQLQQQLWDEELSAHLSLGNIYFEEGRLASAAQHYTTVLQATPTPSTRALMAEAALGLGRSYEMTGNVSQARMLFQRALDLNPALRNELGGGQALMQSQ